VPGGRANTDLIPDAAAHDCSNMIQPDVMQKPVVWLASEASDGVNGQRFIGYYWDEDLPLDERLKKGCGASSLAPVGRPGNTVEPVGPVAVL
jgi:hypothetical protein